MKYLFLLLLTSCTVTTYQLRTPCKVSNSELFEKLTGVLVQEGLQIKTVTSNYLQAETSPETNRYGQIETNIWAFTVKGDTVILRPSTVYVDKNYSKSYDVSVGLDRGNTWYWNVRNEIEKICDSKVLVIEKIQ